MSDYIWIPGSTDTTTSTATAGWLLLDAWVDDNLSVRYTNREEAMSALIVLARSYIEDSGGIGGRIYDLIQGEIDQVTEWRNRAAQNDNAEGVSMWDRRIRVLEEKQFRVRLAEEYLNRFGDQLTPDAPAPEDSRIDNMFEAPEDRTALNFLTVLLDEGYRVYLYSTPEGE